MQFSFWILNSFLVFSLFNPWFKKYDYGAGWPLVLLLAVLLLVIAVLEFRAAREKVLWEKIFLGIFGVSFLFSFVFSETRNLGFSELMAYLTAICAYLIFAYGEIRWRDKFLKFIGVVSVAAVFLGYIFYFTEPENRMFGTFFNIQYHANVWPNAFALFILMSWPVLLLFKNKWLRSFAIAFVLSGLLLTYSRGALIAFGGEVVLLGVYFLRRMDWKTVGWSLLTGVLAVSFFLGANFLRSLKYEVIDVEERVQFENSEGLTSKQERKDFWKGAAEMALEKPVFGYGPFSFRQVYNGKQTTMLANSDHPHNIFLKIAAENGFIALGGFLGFLVVLFVTVAKRFSGMERRERDLVFILGTAIAGAFAHNLIDYNFNFIANLLLLFLFLAFIRSIVSSVGKESKNYAPVAISILLAVIALYEGALLFTNALETSFFPRNYYLNQANEHLSERNYPGVVEMANRQIDLNSYDSEAYLVRGIAYFEMGQTDFGRADLEKAIAMNPLNNLNYYKNYISYASQDFAPEDLILIQKAAEILKAYFELVEKNVHFTAYTPNVEAARDLAYLIIPYLDPAESRMILEGVSKMLATAERLRSLKSF